MAYCDCVCSYKKLECLTPHMCNVCWVNDHMYCRNMKRTSQDLPSFAGGCIHYIPCEHYRQSGRSVSVSQESHGKGMKMQWSNRHGNKSHPAQRIVRYGSGKNQPAHGIMSVEDLFCNEDMLDSESDSSNDGIEGTELLHIQLKARTDQIFRSLGVTELPRSKSPPLPSAASVSAVVTEDDSVALELEEYAAETVIDADGLCVQDIAEIYRVSDAPSETFIARRQEHEMVFGDEAPWTGDYDYNASSGTCSLASFDGTSPHEPPVTVTVHVRQISDDRFVIKYPKYHSAPTEYMHLDVTFPNGATDEVIDSYVKNDVARFICDKKSGLVPDVPVSVTVIRDDHVSQTREEEYVPISQAVVESHYNGLQSTIYVVCN